MRTGLRRPERDHPSEGQQMNFDYPIQTPVTGREKSDDPRAMAQALSQFYRALNSRDMELMQRNWLNSAESAMDNPLGEIKRGWIEIKPTYEKLFASKGAYHFEFYDYTMHETGNLFYVVGRERGELHLGGQPMQLAIRTSRIFQRSSGGDWLQVHHHGSIADPRMLAAYQAVVLGKRDNF
jgi:ketosteroid isomerase-like protein